jgi:acetyl-CoA carboxylase biotin carboxyl carrier protein
VALTDDDVREILRIIDESALDELSIETPGFSLHVRKGVAGGDTRSGAELPRSAPERASTAAQPEPSAAGEPANGAVAIASPMLGTFYRAEAPGASPFVDVGDRVEPYTTVCIIEVMKMMNSVPAGVSGVVTEICSENGQLVEYGEPLFLVSAE